MISSISTARLLLLDFNPETPNQGWPEMGGRSVTLLAKATRGARPRVLVTDRGPQFTSDLFAQATQALAVDHRFGALYRSGSIALIERFWKTLKGSLPIPLLKPLTLGDLERRVDLSVHHYVFHRPHEALAGATPAERFLRLPSAATFAVPAPRGQPGEYVPFPSFEVVHLDDARLLPVLVRRAA